ncbi:MAG: RnfABCDGE type electron transport complex subunit D [Pseudomonadales bacterium]|nr:RnfABCDGE type electron transport complex subunit D [Pseudomonadales bacterium]
MPAISSPFLCGARSVAQIMQLVLLACLPALAFSTWFFGIGLLLNLILASLTALLMESLVCLLRARSITFTLSDYSVLVTAMLLSFAIPHGAPWWIPVSGTAFAVLIGKHVYGGLGYNLFNPAMVGYVALLVSFPLEMTAWHIPSAARTAAEQAAPLSLEGMLITLQLSFPFLQDSIGGNMTTGADGFAMATPLIEYKFAAPSAIHRAWMDNTSPFLRTAFARSAETGWEWINLGFFAGGLFLLWQRIISWHIPVAVLGSLGILSWLFYQPGSEAVYGSPYLHLFISATMIGAFFIATDPVTAPASPRARLAYGCLIGIAIYTLRIRGNYLDSVGFAILLGNLFAPGLDRLLPTRVYGKSSKWFPLRRRSTP